MDWIWIFGCQISGGKRTDPARPTAENRGETKTEGGGRTPESDDRLRRRIARNAAVDIFGADGPIFGGISS